MHGKVKYVVLSTIVILVSIGGLLFLDQHEDLTVQCTIEISEPSYGYLRDMGMLSEEGLTLVTFHFALQSYSFSVITEKSCYGEYTDAFKALAQGRDNYYNDSLLIKPNVINGLSRITHLRRFLVKGNLAEITQAALDTVFTIAYEIKGMEERQMRITPRLLE